MDFTIEVPHMGTIAFAEMNELNFSWKRASTYLRVCDTRAHDLCARSKDINVAPVRIRPAESLDIRSRNGDGCGKTCRNFKYGINIIISSRNNDMNAICNQLTTILNWYKLCQQLKAYIIYGLFHGVIIPRLRQLVHLVANTYAHNAGSARIRGLFPHPYKACNSVDNLARQLPSQNVSQLTCQQPLRCKIHRAL